MAGTQRDISYLEGKFETGDIPTQQDFYDLFASFVHYLQVKQVSGSSTSDVMSQKAISDLFTALKGGVPSAGDTLNKLYNLIVGVGQLVGDFDASAGALPTTGTGLSSAIDKGDYWLITVGGTISGLGTLAVGDMLFAKVANATLAADFFYLPFATLVPDATETVKGKAEISTQAESEDAATNATVGNVDHTRIMSGRGLRYFWDKVKTLATTFSSSLKAKQIAGDYGVLTDGASITWDASSIGNAAQVTLGGNRTLSAITNPLTGAVYTLRVVQDGTGNRTLAFNAAYTFPNGIAPVLNSAVAAVTVYQFLYDGTSFRYILPNGAQRVTDLYINSQIESGKKVFGFIDTTGKFTKIPWMEVNTATRTITKTAADNLGGSVTEQWLNSDLNSILKILNDLSVVVGADSTASMIRVLDSISSGNAGIDINDNQTLAYFLKNKDASYVFKVRTIDDDEAFIINYVLELEQGKGFSVRVVLIEGTTSTTNSAQNIIASLPLDVSQIVEANVLLLCADVADESVVSWPQAHALAKRDSSGTVTSDVDAPTTKRLPNTLTASFSWAGNDSTKTLDLRLQNDATGKEYRVKGMVIYKTTNIVA